MKDVIITLNYWEYLVDFVVLFTKDNMEGYHLILGRTWLATIDSYIAFQSRKMILLPFSTFITK